MAKNYVLTDPRIQRAIRFLEKLLGDSPEGIPSKDVLAAAENEGVSPSHLRKAKDVLSVNSFKEGGPGGRYSRWFWVLDPRHLPMSLPEADPGISHPPAVSHSEVANRLTPQPPQPPQSFDDSVRTWAIRKGYPVSKFGPVPQPLVAAYKRDQAKPVDRVVRLPYESRCPECDTVAAVLTRTVTFRETSDGERIAVDDAGMRSTLCDRCKSSQMHAKRSNVEKRIDSLEYTCRVLASADPKDPNIWSTQEHIKRLRRELADQERTMSSHAR